jgi:AraC-like DNA-binding protein
MTYQEIYADSDMFEKFYEIDNPKKETFVVIPDGCVDIQYLWRDAQMKVQIVGSLREAGATRIADYDKCFGARFKMDGLPRFLQGHVEDLVDSRRMIGAFLQNPALEEIIGFDMLLEQKADCLLWIMGDEETMEENIIIDYIMKEIEKRRGNIVVGDMIESLGYSHRYADRLFKSNIGFSIKKFANIVRLQECVKCLSNKNEDAIYEELGYYDQSHFIHDFKRFTTFTPSGLKNQLGHIHIV